MASVEPRQRDTEAEVFVRVEFHLQRRKNGTVTIHQADIGTKTEIELLKEDLKKMFGDGDPSAQVWSHRAANRTTTLGDDSTLKDHKLDEPRDEKRPLRITVKTFPPDV